jgi:hypothetical protein
MEASVIKSGKNRRSRQEIIQLVKSFDSSKGKTIKSYCKEQQISEAAFYSARNRYQLKNKTTHKSGFIPIQPLMDNQKTSMLFLSVCSCRIP